MVHTLAGIMGALIVRDYFASFDNAEIRADQQFSSFWVNGHAIYHLDNYKKGIQL